MHNEQEQNFCDVPYNIDFKSKYHRIYHSLFNFYNIFFIKLNIFFYLLILFFYFKRSDLLWKSVSQFNIINWSLFLITNTLIYYELSYKILLGLLLSLICLIVSNLDISLWLGLMIYFINITLSRLSKQYIYIYSAKYFYIKFYNYARIN